MLKIQTFPNSNLKKVTDTVLEVSLYMPGSTSYTDACKQLVEAYKKREKEMLEGSNLSSVLEVRYEERS